MSRSVKSTDEIRLPETYELLGSEELHDAKSLGIYLKHKKSGARLALVSNTDNNKVFCIGFRTPPEDSTGVAHIVEHTTLCGSREFPSKDPFVELVKGSMNTFLNAMTYPDKTVYPVASTNDKDFANLMHVYLDAVFYPNFYKNKAIFEQEGWHYELDEKGDTLTYNGVVFNEMKGALSDPHDVESGVISAALFPENTYKYVSGGDPEVIPSLTYENYLAFHKRYYHPSNSYIYLYGDFDIEERLQFMDEHYLSAFDAIDPDSEIPVQDPVHADIADTYSVAESEDTDNRTFLSYNTVVGLSTDVTLSTAIRILQYVMTDAPGAPVKKALIEAGIGKDVSASFETSLRQPVFSIEASGARKEDKERFVNIIENTVRKTIKEGISKKSLLAAVNFFEFKYRESDFGRWPKGLLVGLRTYDTWLYDDTKPFDTIELGGIYKELREKIDTDYYENLLDKYILNNEHKAIVALSPEKGKNEREAEKTARKLSDIRKNMTDSDIAALKENSKKLRAFQENPSTPEELAKIPMLTRADISTKSREVSNIEERFEKIPVLWHNVDTNGIAYIHMLFDAGDMEKEDIQYMKLLAELLGYVDTKRHSYKDFSDEILLHTGGITTDLTSYSSAEDADKVKLFLSVEAKCLADELSATVSLVNEMLFETEFTDETDKRIKEVLAEDIQNMQDSLEANGNGTAVRVASYYVTAAGRIAELASGVNYYRFIKRLSEHFNEEKDKLHEKLTKLIKKYIVRERLTVSLTADEDTHKKVSEYYEKICKGVPGGTANTGVQLCTSLADEIKNETTARNGKGVSVAFTTSGRVQYVGRFGNFRHKGLPYNGLTLLLQVLLSYDYLWVNIRVKGGAYGCSGQFNMDGSSSLSSYRDPNLKETNAIFEGVSDYLRNFKADDRTLTQYIIGTISMIDRPWTPYTAGETALRYYMRGISQAMVEKMRAEILDVTEDGIRSLADYTDALLSDNVLAVVGSEAKINENKEYFNEISSLLN